MSVVNYPHKVALWKAFICLGLIISTVGCFSTDESPIPQGALPNPPEFLENVEIVTRDTSPSAQIDLFVAANNMDTTLTASGLVYSILEPGGQEKPDTSSSIAAWYRAYRTDGVIFDETQDNPFSGPLNVLLKGWQEAIPKIGRGGKIWMLLRPELGYGDEPPRGGIITDTTVLVFEVELLDF